MSSGTSPRKGTPSFSASLRAPPCEKTSVRPPQCGTDEVAHILDHAEQRHLDLVEHRDASTGVDQRQILRRRHDHRAGERHVLSHGQLGVAGARRHIDDQHVQFAPHDLAQELVQRRHHHRSAPDHRRALVDQEPDRHHLDAEAFERNEPLAVRRYARFGIEAEQLGHGRPEQVGVENANGKSELRKPDGEIAGDGRLAHAALAGGDRDDGLDAGQRFARPAVPHRRRLALMGVTWALDSAKRRRQPRAASAVSVTTAPATPGIALIVASASARIGSIALARAGSMAIAAKTLPSRMVTPETAPESRKDARPSGPGIAASAAMTSSRETISVLPARRNRALVLGQRARLGRRAPVERIP